MTAKANKKIVSVSFTPDFMQNLSADEAMSIAKSLTTDEILVVNGLMKTPSWGPGEEMVQLLSKFGHLERPKIRTALEGLEARGLIIWSRDGPPVIVTSIPKCLGIIEALKPPRTASTCQN